MNFKNSKGITKTLQKISSKRKKILLDEINSTPYKLGNIISIIVCLIFISYIYKLETESPPCTCSYSWKRDYIKYYLIVGIIINVISLVNPLLYYQIPYLSGTIGIFGLIFIFVIISYIRELNRKKCNCSKNWKRTFMGVYAYLTAIIILISIIITLFTIVYMANK